MKLTLTAELRGHSGAVHAAAFSSDGLRVVSGGFDGKLVSWDVATKKALCTVATKGHVEDVAFIDANRALATSMYENKLQEWDLEHGALVKAWGAHSSWPRLAVARNASVAVTKGRDGAIAFVWDVARRKKLGRLVGHKFGLDSWEPSQDGTRVITVGWYDQTLRHWDVRKMRETWRVDAWTAGGHVAWSPSGNRFVVAGSSLSVRKAARSAAAVWETTPASPAKAVVWPTSDVIVTCSETSIDAFAATSGAPLASVRVAKKPTRALAASGDGSLVAVGTESGTIQIARLR